MVRKWRGVARLFCKQARLAVGDAMRAQTRYCTDRANRRTRSHGTVSDSHLCTLAIADGQEVYLVMQADKQTEVEATMAVYSYARVSTVRQADEGESLSAQDRQITGYALMQGL